MLNIAEIRKYLEDGERTFVSDIQIRSADDTILVFVSREHLAGKAGHGLTSIKQLDRLKRNLAEHFSCAVEYILIQGEVHHEIESGIFHMLNNRFDNQIQSLNLSFQTATSVDGWIQIGDQTNLNKGEIEDAYHGMLELSKLESRNLYWIDSPHSLPTISYLLRAVKTLQPVTLSQLMNRAARDFKGVDDKWMRNTLDNLRRKGLIIWQQPGFYAVTYQALSVIPSGTSRQSSDIERALVLAKRSW